MTEEAKPADAEAKAPPPAGSKRLLVTAALIVGGLALGGASGIFAAGPMIAKLSGKPDTTEARPEKSEHGATPPASTESTVHLVDNLVMNPAGSGGARFLLVTVGLQMKNSSATEDVKTRDTEVRDAILRILGKQGGRRPGKRRQPRDLQARDHLRRRPHARQQEHGRRLLPAVRDPVAAATMSSEALSQSDIDLLLGGGAAAIPPAARSPETDVQVYDFRRPHRVSKDRLRTIEAMYERLSKSLEAWLIGRVRKQVELRLQSVEQYSYGEFSLSLSTPCAAFGCDIRGLPGHQGVIDVGHEFAYFLVDRFFGGDGQPMPINRALTPIERLAVRGVVDRIATVLAEIWQDHVALELEVTSFESFPDMVQMANREEPVLVANIEVSVENQRSLLLLCLPFCALEDFFNSADKNRVGEMTGTEQERALSRELAEHSLRATHVDVSARLPAVEIPMRQLVGLPVGSILATGHPMDTVLDVLVSGRPRFHATVGRVGQKLAVRLLDVPNASNTASPGSSSRAFSQLDA